MKFGDIILIYVGDFHSSPAHYRLLNTATYNPDSIELNRPNVTAGFGTYLLILTSFSVGKSYAKWTYIHRY